MPKPEIGLICTTSKMLPRGIKFAIFAQVLKSANFVPKITILKKSVYLSPIL